MTLDDLTRRACSEISFTDDEEFEDFSEALLITITDFALSDPDLVGLVSINETRVVIEDNDRDLVLGFLEGGGGGGGPVSVGEADGAVSVCVGILHPGEQRQFSSVVGVIVGTRPVTAGEYGMNLGNTSRFT